MEEKIDYLIVGSGLFGSICAYELNKVGKKVKVIERRSHIGGNCYTENWDNINIHIYGPHIFHTSNKKVWNWINNFTNFNNFVLTTIAEYDNTIYPLPFNMYTFSKMWNITNPQQAKEIIERQSLEIKGSPKNLEEQSIKLIGRDIYEKLIKGYSEKQWKKSATELPPEIIKRLPVRFTFDNNYFDDNYQGIPIGGYTEIFKKLLNGIEVTTNCDFLSEKSYWETKSTKIIYTGPIDEYFDYKFGELEYKTTTFIHNKYNIENYQGCPVINYTDIKIPYTRTIEHKFFEKTNSPVTWVTFEFPEIYNPRKNEPYYPVNDNINNEKYNKYKEYSQNNTQIIFGGRLGEYKYYDMDDVIESALNLVNELISE